MRPNGSKPNVNFSAKILKYVVQAPGSAASSQDQFAQDLQLALGKAPPRIDENFVMRMKNLNSAMGITNPESDVEVCSQADLAQPLPQSFVGFGGQQSYPNVPLYRNGVKSKWTAQKVANMLPGLRQSSAVTNSPVLAPVQNGAGAPIPGLGPLVPTPDGAAAAATARQQQGYTPPLSTMPVDVGAAAQTNQEQFGNTQTDIANAINAFKNAVAGGSQINSPQQAQLYSAAVNIDGGTQSITNAFNASVQRASAQEAKERTDFGARTPSMLFTCPHVSGDLFRGQIVAWKSVEGAAGYVIRRVNVITGEEDNFTVYNEELDAKLDAIKTQVGLMLLQHDVVAREAKAYLDGSAQSDAMLVYSVQAFQMVAPASSNIFAGLTTPAVLSPAQEQALRSTFNPEFGPYPMLAQFLLHDPTLDWVLAGTNVRAAISRNEEQGTIRKLGYLNADIDFLLSRIDAGLFMVPQVAAETVNRFLVDIVPVYGSIQAFGNLLRDTGVLYYFDGIDPSNDPRFDTSLPGQGDPSRFMGIVASAMDTDAASLDLAAFASNLASFVAAGGTSQTKSTPTLVDFPSQAAAFANASGIDVTKKHASFDDQGNIHVAFQVIYSFVKLNEPRGRTR